MTRLPVAAITTLAIMAVSSVASAQRVSDLIGKESITNRPLGLGAEQTEAPEGVEPAATPDVEPATAPKPAEPPPSTFDLKEEGEDVSDKPQPVAINWGTQLVKTVVALLIIVGLIYFLFKIGLTRLLGYATTARGGKSLKIVERVQLDARHALFLIELRDGHRLLVGTGERGVQVLLHLGADGQPAKDAVSFDSVVGRTAAGAVVTMPASEGDRDSHDAG
ncbi:MAG: flagellar biosynthetic protein FliO [Myxococcota bacterium]